MCLGCELGKEKRYKRSDHGCHWIARKEEDPLEMEGLEGCTVVQVDEALEEIYSDMRQIHAQLRETRTSHSAAIREYRERHL